MVLHLVMAIFPDDLLQESGKNLTTYGASTITARLRLGCDSDQERRGLGHL
jgi:hypothetical protein